jgi:transcriptional regulator with XRE-family HTH domain
MQPGDAEKTRPQIHQNEVFQMVFNEKLIQRRKERGMTQEELADRLSVSRQTVSKWENGDCMPDADKFIRLSDILEISLDELAGREVEVEPIVLPAPEVPKPAKKLRRILAAAAACLAIGAACFCLGRYAFPKAAPAGASQSAALPAELKTGGFSMTGKEARFTANADLDGTAILYRADFPDPIKLPATYKDGVYTVANIPAGSYERMVLVLTADDQERSALVVEGLVIDAEGSASWVNP